MTKRHYLLLGLILFATQTFAQTDKEKAVTKGREAVKLMDNGKIDESLVLLEECIKLDPGNIDYPYEMAYAHYISEHYQKSINILEPLTRHQDVTDRVYQLLGNSYDLLGQRAKAIETYEAGLKTLPNAGKLYLELGGMYLVTNEYNKAINYYEKGIDVEPGFSSNYYRLAKIFLNSDEEVWGMIYGELFMNLERNSGRTAEMSRLLFDTYKREIKFTSDTSFTASFSKTAVIDASAKKFEVPFGMVYEMTLMLALLPEKQIDINSLDRIRTGFVRDFYKNNRDKKYPIVLFDYQNRILKEGHLEAYNHWLLMKGDEEGFRKWRDANSAKWDKFFDWFKSNGLKIDDKNKFLRTKF